MLRRACPLGSAAKAPKCNCTHQRAAVGGDKALVLVCSTTSGNGGKGRPGGGAGGEARAQAMRLDQGAREGGEGEEGKCGAFWHSVGEGRRERARRGAAGHWHAAAFGCLCQISRHPGQTPARLPMDEWELMRLSQRWGGGEALGGSLHPAPLPTLRLQHTLRTPREAESADAVVQASYSSEIGASLAQPLPSPCYHHVPRGPSSYYAAESAVVSGRSLLDAASDEGDDDEEGQLADERFQPSAAFLRRCGVEARHLHRTELLRCVEIVSDIGYCCSRRERLARPYGSSAGPGAPTNTHTLGHQKSPFTSDLSLFFSLFVPPSYARGASDAELSRYETELLDLMDKLHERLAVGAGGGGEFIENTHPTHSDRGLPLTRSFRYKPPPHPHVVGQGPSAQHAVAVPPGLGRPRGRRLSHRRLRLHVRDAALCQGVL